jgi:hypothetical protein
MAAPDRAGGGAVPNRVPMGAADDLCCAGWRGASGRD